MAATLVVVVVADVHECRAVDVDERKVSSAVMHHSLGVIDLWRRQRMNVVTMMMMMMMMMMMIRFNAGTPLV